MKFENTRVAKRFLSGYRAFDLLFDKGVPCGSVVILSGQPGVGKTTLLAEIAKCIRNQKRESANASRKVLFVSGEQSVLDLKKMLPGFATRASGIELVANPKGVDVVEIAKHAQKTKPVLIVIDSLQFVYSSSEPDGAMGYSAQQRASVRYLAAFARETGTIVVFTSHTHKNGNPAIDAVVTHAVDAIIDFKQHRDKICAEQGLRVLSCTKNRFFQIGLARLVLLLEGKCVDTGAEIR